MLRFFSIYGDPDSSEVIFNNISKLHIDKKICPICRVRESSTHLLSVGYRKRFWKIAYRIFYITYSFEVNELTTKINICDVCKDRYLFLSNYKILSIFYRNPSKRVLKKKVGYLIGLQFPFEKWNIS